MAKALEVLIDGKHLGYFVPPEGSAFGVMVGNVPIHYMRAQVSTGGASESWYWQLPDIEEGQDLTLRLVDVDASQGRPPARIEAIDASRQEEIKRMAREAAQKAREQKGKNA
jgi:hypothetical protein